MNTKVNHERRQSLLFLCVTYFITIPLNLLISYEIPSHSLSYKWVHSTGYDRPYGSHLWAICSTENWLQKKPSMISKFTFPIELQGVFWGRKTYSINLPFWIHSQIHRNNRVYLLLQCFALLLFRHENVSRDKNKEIYLILFTVVMLPKWKS